MRRQKIVRNKESVNWGSGSREKTESNSIRKQN